MLVTCVGCNTTATLDAPAGSACAKCGAPQRLAGRFVALQRSGVVRSDGLDEVEGAAPLFDGVGEPLRLYGQGLVLHAKRLEQGRFTWSATADGVAVLTPAQLSMLLEGVDWRHPIRSSQPTLAW